MKVTEKTVLDGIVTALSAPAIVLTADGDVVDVRVNDRTESLLVDDPSALVGQNVEDLLPAADAVNLQSVIHETLQTGETQTFDYELSVRAGDRYFSGSVSPLSTDEPMAVLVASDITEERTRNHDLRLFRRLIDEVPDSIYILDPDTGELLDVNQTACTLLGYDRDELIGTHIWDLATEFDGPADYTEFLETQVTGNFGPLEVEHERADGTTVAVEVTSSHVSIEGEAYRIGIARDITERVRRRAERDRQYAHLLRTEALANTGGFDYVPTTDELFLTDGIYNIFDIPEDHTTDIESLFDMLVGQDRKRLEDAFLACIEQGESMALDAQILTSNDRHRWVTIRSECTSEDGVTRIVGVIQDITEQKLDEQRLMVLNRVLRHNLRNKLTAILGHVELLEEQLSDETREQFEMIEQCATDLLSLAEKSRRFKRVVEYDFTVGRLDVSPVLEDVCKTFRERYPNATITNDCMAAAVPVHELELELVLAELVDNALKHSDQPNPHVSILVDRNQESSVSITVADDGPGLPESERAVLREGRETDLLHSSGMGLWIVNWVVMKRSGDITVASNSPQGTIITVTLPTNGVTDNPLSQSTQQRTLGTGR